MSAGVTDVPTVFFGRLPVDYTQAEFERLVHEYGEPAVVDLKRGYGFVRMRTMEQSQDVVKGLDGVEVKGQRIRVEFSKKDSEVRQKQAVRDVLGEMRKSKVLFIANLDPRTITREELKARFESHGPIARFNFRDTFALIEFENMDDAIKAKSVEDGSAFGERTLKVQYSVKLDGDNAAVDGGRSRGGREGRGRRRSTSRGRRSRSRSRSRSRGKSRSRSRGKSRSRSRGRGRSREKSRDKRRSRSRSKSRGRRRSRSRSRSRGRAKSRSSSRDNKRRR